MKIRNILLFAVIFFMTVACSNDDETTPTGEFSSGVFIVNEGNFGGGNGTISHYNPADGTSTNNIFQAVNAFALGDVVQSMHINGEFGYVVVNNSTKVEVVRYATFNSEATISEGLASPRYIEISGSKGYISNWGNFDASFQLDQSFIAIINLADYSLEKQVNTDDGSENLLLSGNHLFVSNSFTNTVQVMDISTEVLISTIEVVTGPAQMVDDGAGTVWVICTGGFGGDEGAIIGISKASRTVSRTVNLGLNPSGKIAYDQTDQNIYFYAGKEVYQWQVGNSTIPEKFISLDEFTGIYGIGFDPQADELFVSDAVGFSGNGTVRRYDTQGNLVGDFSAGVGPNSFVFTYRQ